MRTTVKDYGAAYRAACRAIGSVGNLAMQAALRRALNPVPLQRLEVLGLYVDKDPRSQTIDCARALYRWRFAGNTGPSWDVDVDERYARCYHGIECYLGDLPRP